MGPTRPCNSPPFIANGRIFYFASAPLWLALMPSLQQNDTSKLWALQGQEDGINTNCLNIPHALRRRIIEAAHQFLGHAGINVTSCFCRKRFFMFRLVPEVHRVVQQCHPCQVKDQKAPKQKDVHRPSVQAGAPFQVWSMDILGPLRASSEGHRYLLTLKDVLTANGLRPYLSAT